MWFTTHSVGLSSTRPSLPAVPHPLPKDLLPLRTGTLCPPPGTFPSLFRVKRPLVRGRGLVTWVRRSFLCPVPPPDFVYPDTLEVPSSGRAESRPQSLLGGSGGRADRGLLRLPSGTEGSRVATLTSRTDRSGSPTPERSSQSSTRERPVVSQLDVGGLIRSFPVDPPRRHSTRGESPVGPERPEPTGPSTDSPTSAAPVATTKGSSVSVSTSPGRSTGGEDRRGRDAPPFRPVGTVERRGTLFE